MSTSAVSNDQATVGDNATLIASLLEALDTLRHREEVVKESPPECSKRASVAVILVLLRTGTTTQSTESPSSSWIDVSHDSRESSIPRTDVLNAIAKEEDLGALEPHLLFIRRAARSTDRWSSHVALPGGRRDTEDDSDRAAAVRETLEEVGLDLDRERAIPCGSLDQRLVTTSFGTRPLLTLCPYVFLLGPRDALPALELQESEVASAHWVPISQLLDPASQTFERVDISSRLSGQSSGILKSVMRMALGDMHFSGTLMSPTLAASTYSIVPDAVQDAATSGKTAKPETLVMWGLTQGVIIDFLTLLPTSRNRTLWRFPTFTAPDLSFVLRVLNYRNERRIRNTPEDAETEMNYVGRAVKEYYKFVKPAIVITITARIGLLCGLLYYTFH